MSYRHRKNVSGATLERRHMPERESRHGKPVSECYAKHWRTVETDKVTGEIKVVHHSRPMTPTEIQEARDSVLRASRSTVLYGEKNTPEGMAPKGKGGK